MKKRGCLILFGFLFSALCIGCGVSGVVPKGTLEPLSSLSKARLAILDGQTKKAEENLNKIIKNTPQSETAPEAYYLLGEAYRHDGKGDAAIEAYRETYAKFPKNPYSALAMRKEALVFRGKGKFEDAIAVLEKSAETHPVQFNFESCMYAIGHIYVNDLKDFDKAAEYFKKLLAKSPKNIHYEVQAINYLANIYYGRKDYNQALVYYQDLVDRFGWSKEAKEAVDKLDELEETLAQ